MLKDDGNNGRKPHLKIFQISSLNGSDNGLFVMGHVNKILCRMIINAGANITTIRTDLAQKLGKELIWMSPYVALQTVISKKINVQGKIYLNIAFGDATYHRVTYVADISHPFIL